MGTNDIVTLISSLGFPIVTAMYLMWYNNKQISQFREDIKELREKQDEQIEKTNEAINNNTLVVQQLCETLRKDNV